MKVAFALFALMVIFSVFQSSLGLNCTNINAGEYQSLMKAKFKDGITEKECETIGGLKTHCSSSKGEEQCKKDAGANYKPVAEMKGKCTFSKKFCCLSV